MATITTINPTQTQAKILRVAAYCRVSSSSDDQLHSFASQVQYYTTIIGENPKWELADIYADEGLTGTKTDSREDFLRMIDDCKKGRIDRVLTKSLSRFARNTVDSLIYARMLRDMGISILFEKENIDTAYMSSELLLAVSGAQAQEESISISKNMRQSCEYRMRSGTFLSSSTPYGYRFEGGEFVIVPEEAEIVKLIFKSYLSGMGKKNIADMLNKMDAPKRFGYTVWRINTVNYILNNERYIGDAIFQKKYTTDTLPFKSKTNYGEKPKYYVEAVNTPIIARSEFNAVKALQERHMVCNRKDVTVYPLSEKIICSCGHMYKPVTVNRKKYWECRIRNLDISLCQTRRIPESDIYEAFITLINKLRNNHRDILLPAIGQIEQLQMKAGGMDRQIKQIDKEIVELNAQSLVLARLNFKGVLRSAEYAEQNNTIIGKVNALRRERRKLLQEQDSDETLSGLRELNEIFTGLSTALTEFNERLFSQTIQKITVPTDTCIRFTMIGGISFTEEIPEQRRCRRK
ncbi:MAG: recombinase family protein [Eubacteriales bacterium]|nr:recombinase family protein [Eubacteriales bacterium]